MNSSAPPSARIRHILSLSGILLTIGISLTGCTTRLRPELRGIWLTNVDSNVLPTATP